MSKKKETKVARLKRIASKVYNPADCAYCGGTGIDIRYKNRKLNGCAQCLVRTTVTSINPTDLLWLLKEAAR